MSQTYPQTEEVSPLRAIIGPADSLILGMIMLALAALAGFGDGPVPRASARLILRRFILPAESALRRLILLIAATLAPVILPPRLPRAAAGKGAPAAPRPGRAPGEPVFCLTEPQPAAGLPRAPRPRIRGLDVAIVPATPVPPPAEDTAFTERLRRRLRALEAAFDDPHEQALRLLRRCAEKAARPGPAGLGLSFFRVPGDTPGLHDTQRAILRDLNQAARNARLPQPDSS